MIRNCLSFGYSSSGGCKCWVTEQLTRPMEIVVVPSAAYLDPSILLQSGQPSRFDYMLPYVWDESRLWHSKGDE